MPPDRILPVCCPSVLVPAAALEVYGWCMTRTNIDIDDALVAEAMRRHGLKTKKEAVDLALRRLVGPPVTKEFLLSLRGMGWDADLTEMRRSDVIQEL